MARRVTDDASKWTAAELREAGVPYCANPDQLLALGIDPNQYLRTMPGEGGVMTGYVLDRNEHADIIERLTAMNFAPATRGTA